MARTEQFLAYVTGLAAYADHTYNTAHKALLATAHSDEEKRSLTDSDAQRVPAIEALAAHRQFFMEMLLARHMENYLAYVSALLALVFRKRPETMRSSEKVDIEWVLNHSTMPSLIDDLAERKVDGLSYSSFTTLYEYARDRFGLSVCSETDVPDFVEWIETRNIAVHNRAIVNRRYLDRVQTSEWRLGQQRQIGLNDIERVELTLFRNVQALDGEARKKLRLAGTRFSVPDLLRAEADKSRTDMKRTLAAGRTTRMRK